MIHTIFVHLALLGTMICHIVAIEQCMRMQSYTSLRLDLASSSKYNHQNNVCDYNIRLETGTIDIIYS